jgi:hypothetical protein
MPRKLGTIGGLAATTRRGGRRLSASRRALPQFVVIGSQKAGTSSLARHLAAHPDVFWAPRTEVHYFDWSFDRGLSWYRSWFPRQAVLEAHQRSTGRAARVGEKTPEYFIDPHTPARLAASMPEARLVVALRDPASRAYSQWAMNTYRGVETLSFADALAAEDERLASVDHTRSLRGSHYYLHGYVMRGRYADHLQRWFAEFDRSQILVYRCEDLYADPESWTRTICEHIGIDPDVQAVAAFPHHNATDRERLDPGLRAQLVERLEPSDAQLHELLGWSYYQSPSRDSPVPS